METEPTEDLIPSRLEGLRRLGAATAAGAVAGFLVGGVGGRLAMLLLRLTSDPSLHGRSTDDGFTIGIVSGETMFLLVATTILGAIGGAVYVTIRPWLSHRSAAWVAAALGGTIGGAAIVRPNGVDFTALAPLPLAVAMFVAIAALGAASTAALTERLLGRGEHPNAWLLGLVPFLLLVAIGPTGAAVVASIVLIAAAGPALSPLVRRPAVLVLGRVAIAAVIVVEGIVLIGDVAAVL